MVGEDAEEGGAAAALAATGDGPEDVLGAVAEDGGAVGGSGDGDGGAAKPDDGGGEVEESEDGEELGEVAAEGGEGGDAADPLVHGGDVVGDDSGAGAGLGPATDHGGEGDGAALGVAPVRDELEGALGGVEGGAGESEGAGGGGDGGGGGGGGGGGEVELGGGDGGLGVLDATLLLGDILGEGVGEEVVDGALLLEVDDCPYEARELLADAQGSPAFELAGGRVDLLDEPGACGGGEDGMEDGMGSVGEDGVDPVGGGREGSVAQHGFDDAVVGGEGAGGTDVSEAACGLLDIASGGAERGRAWLVGNVGGGEAAWRGLRVEGDEGAFGVVEAGVGGGGGGVGAVCHAPLALVGAVG